MFEAEMLEDAVGSASELWLFTRSCLEKEAGGGVPYTGRVRPAMENVLQREGSMNCFKKLGMKVAMLVSIGLALSLAGIGQTTVTWDAPEGVVWEMVLGTLGPPPLAAQNGNGNGNGPGEEWTCGWCQQVLLPVHGQGNQWFHWFSDEGGDRCLSEGKPDTEGSPPEWEHSYYCAQCQPGAPLGHAPCHTTWGEAAGQCHEPCGGTGPNGNGNGAGNGNGGGGGQEALLAQRATLEEALAAGDVQVIVRMIVDQRPGSHALEYVPEGGRIELFGPCDRIRPVAIVPVPLAVRDGLARYLAVS
jgi:hypothetical protein